MAAKMAAATIGIEHITGAPNMEHTITTQRADVEILISVMKDQMETKSIPNKHQGHSNKNPKTPKPQKNWNFG